MLNSTSLAIYNIISCTQLYIVTVVECLFLVEDSPDSLSVCNTSSPKQTAAKNTVLLLNKQFELSRCNHKQRVILNKSTILEARHARDSPVISNSKVTFSEEVSEYVEKQMGNQK